MGKHKQETIMFQNIGSLLVALRKSVSWSSFIVIGSFFLYLTGYLALRFHLAALGLAIDLPMFDERYLFDGARFFVYLVSTVPSLLLVMLLILLLGGIITLLCWILSFGSGISDFFSKRPPSSLRNQTDNCFHNHWSSLRPKWLTSDCLAWLGIILAVLMIQLVMRQCFLLNNLLLAKDLSEVPGLLNKILLDPTDGYMALYFSSLVYMTLLSASIFYYAWKVQESRSVFARYLLGFLLGVQLLLLPVNYGVLVLDKLMPRVTEVITLDLLKSDKEVRLVWEGNKSNTFLVSAKEDDNYEKILVTLPKSDKEAWLVWEGDKSKTFLIRGKREDGNYEKSLVTLPNKDVQRLEISQYDPIFYTLYGNEETSSPARGK